MSELAKKLEDYKLERVHLVGIGGAAMNALAEVLLDMGYSVSGSDLKLSATTKALTERGATIFEGHQPENVSGATLVVRTVAAKDDNPELAEARRQNIPVLAVAEIVGMLVNAQRCLAIAGTHGKTTTTAFVSWLFSGAGLDPLYFIGGISQNLHRAGYAGKGEISVIEADEYARRFLELRPEIAVINNIEPDHLDYYGSFEAVIEAFADYARNVKSGGTLIAKLPQTEQEEGLAKLGEILLETGYLEDRNYETFAIVEEANGEATFEAVVKGVNAKGGYDFEFYRDSQLQVQVSLIVPGLHNVLNATAALAMCSVAAPQISISDFAKLAGEFKGTQRRFEEKGEIKGVTIIDDYAHYPTEIKATLAAARSRFAGRRIIALFQPHTYTRTKEHLIDFAQSFGEADLVAIMEIFAARESDTLGISSQALLDKIVSPVKLPQTLTHETAAQALQQILKPGDVLLTLGAGDVWKVGEEILAG